MRLSFTLLLFAAAGFAQDVASPVLAEGSIPGRYAGTFSLVDRASAYGFKVIPVDEKGNDLLETGTRTVLIDQARRTFELELSGPLPANTSCVAVIEVVTVGGVEKSSAKSNCLKLPRGSNWIDVASLPIREGDDKIEGKAGASVKAIRVFVRARGTSREVQALRSEFTQALPETEASSPATVLRRSQEKLSVLQAQPEVALPDLEARMKQQSLAAFQSNPTADTAADLRCQAGDLVSQFDIAVKDNAFSGNFPRGVGSGHCVVVRALVDGQAAASGPDAFLVQPVGQDWGRMRGTFYLGVAVGRSSGSTGQTDPYFGFYFDANLQNFRGIYQTRCESRDPGRQTDCLVTPRKFRFSWHGFTEGRMTQAALPSITGSATTSTQSRASLFQGGLYFPISWAGMDYVHDGQQYSFFLAPIAKYGVQTPDKEIPLAVTSVTYPAETTPLGRPVPAATVPTSVTVKDVAGFYGSGVRLGLFRYEQMGPTGRNRQIAPDLLSYVDVLYGQYGLYRDEKLIEESGRTSRSIYVVNPRVAVEARFKLPWVPLQVGVDYNVSSRGVEKSPADLRFIFATRVDAAAALAKVFNGDKKK